MPWRPPYRRLLDHLQPQQLLGLTATPERGDGVDVAQQFFDGRTASELRLWDALDADLLVPFHYFGVSDDVELALPSLPSRSMTSASASSWCWYPGW